MISNLYLVEIMNKKVFIHYIPIISVFIFCWLVLPAAANNSAQIVDAEIGQDGENLQVSFRIENCFTPSMEEAVLSGVPTTFRIRALIEKGGNSLFPTQILDVVLEHTIKFDSLKNEYTVQLPESPITVLVTKDFDEAKRWMSTVQQLPLIPLWRLEKGQSYLLSLKAELSKVELPLFFRYIFFFVSLWDFETSWQRIPFSL